VRTLRSAGWTQITSACSATSTRGSGHGLLLHHAQLTVLVAGIIVHANLRRSDLHVRYIDEAGERWYFGQA